MAFEKNNWKSGDVISSTKLNAMEDGIVEGSEPAAWAEITGKPTTFAPSEHTHTIANVTGLQAKLDDFEARLSALETPAVGGE